jgi:hypothetical protein
MLHLFLDNILERTALRIPFVEKKAQQMTGVCAIVRHLNPGARNWNSPQCPLMPIDQLIATHQ